MVQATTSEIDDAIRRILAEHTPIGAKAAGLTRTDNLFEAGLESVSAVNVMLALEEAFGFEFPDAALTRETFSTIGAMADIIGKAA